MNIVFGCVREADGVSEKFRHTISRQFDASVEFVGAIRASGETPVMSAGFLRDDHSVMLGRAENSEENVAVLLLGCLNQPAPGWVDGSPMDSPDSAAQYLLDRYLKLHDNFADGLHGQYAVVVLDHRKQRLLMTCDSTGLRTLFYAVKGKDLYFSSNLATLAASVPGVQMNQEMEDFFLCHGFYPWAQTPYEDVTYLEPGAFACFQDGALSLQKLPQPELWSGLLADLDFEAAGEEQAVEQLYSAFMLATEQQLASSPNAAVLLGGADSALTASALHRLGKKVETFSFYYEDESFNQPHTDTLSDYLGTRHHWIPINSKVISDGIENYPWVFNYPTNWLSYVVQTEYLCKEIKRAGFDYVYSGDGCDVAFFGYPRTHVFASFMNSAVNLPPHLVRWMTRALNFDAVERTLGRPYTVLLHAIRSMGRKMPERGYSTFRVLDENSLSRLKSCNAFEVAHKNNEILHTLAGPLSGLSMDRLAYSGKGALSPNRSKLAGSSDSTGVVINSPYMHSGMKRFASSLPDSLLRPTGDKNTYNGKYLLFKMADEKRLLPPEIIYQKKIAAVDAPIDRWYMGEMQGLLRTVLARLPFDADGRYLSSLLQDKSINRFYRRHLSSDSVTTHAVSLLSTYSQYASLRSAG